MRRCRGFAQGRQVIRSRVEFKNDSHSQQLTEEERRSVSELPGSCVSVADRPPAADKILTSAAFISLVELGLAPAWMVAIIVAREFAVSTPRSVIASDRVVVSATLSGKIKTIAQIVAISALIVQHQLGEFSRVAPALLWVALAASVYSGIEYFVRFSPLLVKLWRADQAAADSGDG